MLVAEKRTQPKGLAHALLHGLIIVGVPGNEVFGDLQHQLPMLIIQLGMQLEKDRRPFCDTSV